MFRYVSLVGHSPNSVRFARLSSFATRRRQLARFRRLVEHAREPSPFYRQLYRETGVDRLVIRDWADIERVPMVDKALLRTVPTQDLMTGSITPDLVRITTSGSTGEPFVIYQTRMEQYTSHVFAMLWELGWRTYWRGRDYPICAPVSGKPRPLHGKTCVSTKSIRRRSPAVGLTSRVYRSFNGQDVMNRLAAAVIGRLKQ